MPFVRTNVLRPAVFAVLTVLLIAPLAAQTVQPRLTRPIDEGKRVTLAGTTHPLARASNDRGLAADNTPLDRVQVVLKRSDAQDASLKQLVTDMHTPGSPSYHHWLTPDQFGQQFGPSDVDVQTLETWLRSKGFSIGALAPGRQTLDISGTAATFRNAFHTDIHRYDVNGQAHFANASDPQIPAALAPVFGGFASLNNFHIKANNHPRGHATYNPVTRQSSSDWSVTDKGGVDLVLAPSDYAVQYDIPNGLNPAATPTVNGSGQTIAIVNDSNINVYLANRFRTLFGLSPNPPQVIIDGNDPGVDGNNNPDGPNGDSLEAYLDVEWAGAVAPNATIDLVIAGDTNLESGLVLALEHAIYSNLAPVLSLSFGACELQLGSGNQFLAGLYQQAAAQGITVLVSSGDAGSAGCDDDNTATYAVNGQAVNGFGSTPYNVSVGGTDFYYSSYNQGVPAQATELANYWNMTTSNSTPATSIRGVIPEQPWNDSQFGLNIRDYYATTGNTNIIGAGGGASNCGIPTVNSSGQTVSCLPYPKPSWQTGVTGIPVDGARDLPDVSLFAANGLNYSYYPVCVDDGDCQSVSSGSQVQISGVGGTSASTPAFAGIMAMINQKYGRQGQANYVLYPLAKQYPASFHDVIAGTNAVPCLLQTTTPLNCIAPTATGPSNEGMIGKGTTPEYNASAGYDLASGLGTIDANILIGNWDKVVFNATTTQLTPSSTSFTHGATINIAGSVTGTSTPTGTVELMTDSSEISEQAQLPMTLSNGTFSQSNLSTLPGGTYNIWGQYGGDGSDAPSTSAKTMITVAPENSDVFFLTTTPTSQGISILTSPSSTAYAQTIPYGSELTLFGLVAPTKVLTAFENCETLGGTCPIFTPPTGTVTFLDNAATINAAAINSEADAEFSYPFGVGTHSFTAQYSGDSSYNSSSAIAQTLAVVKSTPFIGLSTSSSNGAQVVSGQPWALHVYAGNNYNTTSPVVPPSGTITLTGVPPNLTTPISLTLVPAYNAGVASYGVATTTLNATVTPGNYTVTMSYGGDSNYNAYTNTTSLQFLAASGLSSTTTATANNSATSPAAAVSVTVIVTGSGSVAPTGTLSLRSSGTTLGTYALPTGTNGNSVTKVIVLNSETLLQGTNLISVLYSGDTTYQSSVASISVTNPLSDFLLTPATSIVGVPTSGIATDILSLASSYGFSGGVNLSCTAPTGITCSLSSTPVTLTAGGVGSSTLNLNTSGITLSGSYPILITASDAATSTHVHTLNIAANITAASATPSFGLTNGGAITLASPGANGSSAITVTPTNGFTGSVALSCAVTSSPTGAVHAPTCTVTSPVNVVSATAGAATLAVNTTASAAVHDAPLERFLTVGGGATLAMLLFFGVPRRRSWRGLLGALVFVALMFGVSGCGGGSGSGGTNTPTGPTNTGTTFGSYTITVTGTSGITTTSTLVTVVVN